MKTIFFITSLTLVFFSACSSDKNSAPAADTPELSSTTAEVPAPAPAELLLTKTIEAHGGNRYEQAHYQFVFRDKTYRFQHNGLDFHYQLEFKNEDGEIILDELVNSHLSSNGQHADFRRSISGIEAELSDKDIAKYTEALNSVIYFATLPYKLQDPAVNLVDHGSTVIKGQSYNVLEVNFDEEGGGVDHDDEFYYWINQETSLIDFLAYSYQVNGGGVRFRSAYNTRHVGGIVFQDFINFKAEVGTPLATLPALYEKGALAELSRIETEDVIQLP